LTAQLWEVSGHSIADGAITMTVRASAPVPVRTEADGAVIPRYPPVSNLRFALDQPGALSLAFDVPAELKRNSNNTIRFRVEYRRDGGEFEYVDVWMWDEFLRLYDLCEPGVYTDIRVITRSASGNSLRDSLPVALNGTLTVRETGGALPFRAENVTSSIENNGVFMITVNDIHLINPGGTSLVHLYSDLTEYENWTSRSLSGPGSHMFSTGIGGNRIPAPGAARVTLQDYSASINGNIATVTLSPKQEPAIIVPTQANGQSSDPAVRAAPQNVRFEEAGNGIIQLVWDEPAWAADNDEIWTIVEAKLVSAGEWTIVNRVRPTETRRSAASIILHWSEPRTGEPYQFRVRFGERDTTTRDGYSNYTDYTYCSGTLAFTVESAPFTAQANFLDNSMTVYGSFAQGREYFFVFDNQGNPNNNFRTWIGFAASETKTSHDFGDLTTNYGIQITDMAGGNAFAWEVYGGVITGSNANLHLSAAPTPVKITANR
jgi:hypothetical protein